MPRGSLFVPGGAGHSCGIIRSGLTHEQPAIHPSCIHSQDPPPEALLSCLISLFIAHSSRLMSLRDLTKCFIRAPRPVGSCSAAAER
ncbi:hypothetical protein VZT92_005254 [Zoarces viviparus]|uniref:Uncharacterized protein n=1 Tax=Zoarces viviparus TaxID=48416 RepID=A0AAW1FSH3_ZOAVI